MAQRPRRGKYTEAEARQILACRLEDDRTDIECSIRQRIDLSLSDEDSSVPEYVVGLQASVPAAASFGIAAIRDGASPPPPVPVELLTQARLAAQYQLSIDGVLRRYIAGRSLLDRALVSQHRRDHRFGQDVLDEVINSVAVAFEYLATVISEEFSRAISSQQDWAVDGKLCRVQRLLAGEAVSPSGLGYDLRLTHIAVAGEGPEIAAALRPLAERLGAQLLAVNPFPEVVWGWLGIEDAPDPRTLTRAASTAFDRHEPVGIGGGERGLAGWKRTNDQARIALVHAVERCRPTFYAEIAVAHAIKSEPLLYASLRRRYLAPLESARDGGTDIKAALRAFYDAECNRTAAGAALEISRRTLSSRLAQAEVLLGQPILGPSLELQLALSISD